MAFTGTWVQTSAENADGVLRYVGMPEEQIKEMTSLPVTVELKQDGDKFFEKFTVGTDVMDVFFHIGKESLIPLITGGEVKTVPRYDGPNKTVAEYDHKGVHYYGYRELLSPTEFVDDNYNVLRPANCIKQDLIAAYGSRPRKMHHQIFLY